MARGDGAGALGELRECGRLLLARQMTNPALLPWRSASARALALTGDDAGAAELVAEERRLALAWGAPRTLARALRAAGDADPEHGGEPAPGAAAARLVPGGPASWQFRQALVAMGTGGGWGGAAGVGVVSSGCGGG
ncbi:helix-turn-helix transcriptional regulator, partial [Kitasatospora sp. NPDC059463]